MNKPEVIVKTEQFILENEPEFNNLEDRIHRLKTERPELHFEGRTTALTLLDKRLTEAEKKRAALQIDLAGARQVLKRQLREWIQAEQEKLEEEAVAFEKQADAAAKKTAELIKKIEEINGTILVRFHNEGSKEQKLRKQAEFKRKNIEKVPELAEKMLVV